MREAKAWLIGLGIFLLGIGCGQWISAKQLAEQAVTLERYRHALGIEPAAVSPARIVPAPSTPTTRDCFAVCYSGCGNDLLGIPTPYKCQPETP